MDTITLLPLLSQSLSSDPQTRRGAERHLTEHEPVPGFLLSVLSIVQGAGEAPMEIRLAAGIYFKNAVKKMWAEVSLRTRWKEGSRARADLCRSLYAGAAGDNSSSSFSC
jgi:hypothetical protein